MTHRTQNHKNLLTFLSIIFFIVLALASHPLKNIPSSVNAFAMKEVIDDQKDTGNYMIKFDGTKIYGKELSLPYGFGRIKGAYVDGISLNPNDIKGYRQDGIYYGRNGLDFIPRILYGKISIYKGKKTGGSKSSEVIPGPKTTTYYNYDAFYAEKNNDGRLIWIYNIIQVRELVKDCPKALEMVKVAKNNHWEIMKENPGYIIKILSVYNNNCNDVK